jgi:hypothetical protein
VGIAEVYFKVRSFLGLAGYYRRFIEGFSKLALTMTQLTGKDRLMFGMLSVRRVSKS